MSQPPPFLDGAKVLCYCSLGEPVKPTGQHYIVVEGEPVFPANAAICQYEGSSIFYRFYCDEHWEVLSDVDYASTKEAIEAVEAAYKGAGEMFNTET